MVRSNARGMDFESVVDGNPAEKVGRAKSDLKERRGHNLLQPDGGRSSGQATGHRMGGILKSRGGKRRRHYLTLSDKCHKKWEANS